MAQEALDEVRALIAERFGSDFLPPQVRTAKAKGAQEAHEAIRPTSSLRAPEALRGHITSDQHRLYNLIWRRFVASPDTTAVDAIVASGEGKGEGEAIATSCGPPGRCASPASSRCWATPTKTRTPGASSSPS